MNYLFSSNILESHMWYIPNGQIETFDGIFIYF